VVYGHREGTVTEEEDTPITESERKEIGAALKKLAGRITEVEVIMEELSEMVLMGSQIEMELAKRLLKLEGEEGALLT
jgi:hypothetical protein